MICLFSCCVRDRHSCTNLQSEAEFGESRGLVSASCGVAYVVLVYCSLALGIQMYWSLSIAEIAVAS